MIYGKYKESRCIRAPTTTKENVMVQTQDSTTFNHLLDESAVVGRCPVSTSVIHSPSTVLRI